MKKKESCKIGTKRKLKEMKTNLKNILLVITIIYIISNYNKTLRKKIYQNIQHIIQKI